MATYADVIISITHSELDKIFQYKIPDHLIDKAQIGVRVEVPFGKGNKPLTGYIIGLGSILMWDEKKTKSIERVLDEEEVISQVHIQLAMWMKERYGATLSSCLQTILPKQILNKVRYYNVSSDEKAIQLREKILNGKTARNQQSVLRFLLANGTSTIKVIREYTGVKLPVIRTLLEKGLMVEVDIEPSLRAKVKNVEKEQPLTLSFKQQTVLDGLLNSMNRDGKNPVLLHGITGSGKTEVYMQLIKKVIDAGKEAIVLVPEISLTPQMARKFYDRFGDLVEVTHSRRNATERFAVWKKAKKSEIKIILGPRSAIFTPFQNLGVIIVDEEHELTYKSEQIPKYHTIETGKKLCELTNSLLVLGSATPSVESYHRSLNGSYELMVLNERVSAKLPEVELVDMREELQMGNKGILSMRLKEAIEDRLAKKEQVILFLNRRGHSTFVSCRQCGYVMNCERCNLPYTYHQSSRTLQCHHCGKQERMVESCPTCGSKYIKHFGIGTQKVEEHIKELFPDYNILRMDLDTTSRKGSHKRLYEKFRNQEAQILIGTQMIAKGLDFPKVTLVGVLAADMSIFTSDFRSGERTFQLLTQVAGRAGRSTLPGEVIIQTYSPDHYSVQASLYQDYHKFYHQEISFREAMEYPPFTNMASFLIQGNDEKMLIQSAHDFGRMLNHYGKDRGFTVIGPAPATISKLNNTYRWCIIVKHKEYDRLKNFVLYCVDKHCQYNKEVHIGFDLNPLMM